MEKHTLSSSRSRLVFGCQRIMPIHFISMFIISTPLFFSISSLAAIQYTKIESKNRTLLFIDAFGFTETGHLELNVSRISFSNPNPNTLNFSLIGFFLAPRDTMGNGDMYGDNHTTTCYLQSSDFIKIVYTSDKWTSSIEKNGLDMDMEFSMSYPDEVDLYFENCLPHLQLSMDIRSSMYNLDDAKTGRRNYLSTSDNCLLGVHFIFLLSYLLFTLLWIWILHWQQQRKNSSNGVFRIHYIIPIIMVLKMSSFLIQLVNLFYIKDIGYAKSLVVLFMSISGLFAGVYLLALLGLIGSGWSFLKPRMQLEEKILLTVVISVRIIFNIVNLSKSIGRPCGEWCVLYQVLSPLVNVVCSLALIFPIAWNTRRLLDASQVEGKATLSFVKLKRLRKLFFTVVFYSIFFNGFVYMFEVIVMLTGYFWKGVVVREFTTFAISVFIGYTFRPEVQNQRFVIDNDVEMAAAETLKDERTYDLMNHILKIEPY